MEASKNGELKLTTQTKNISPKISNVGWLGHCDKCHKGNTYLEKYDGGYERICLQCGFSQNVLWLETKSQFDMVVKELHGNFGESLIDPRPVAPKINLDDFEDD